MYRYNKEQEKGMSCPVFFFTCTHGSNVGNYYFVWRAPEHVCMEACRSENKQLI